MKKLLFILSIIFFLSCSKDNPIEPIPNNNSKDSLTVLKISRIEFYDENGKVGDIYGYNHTLYTSGNFTVTNGKLISHGSVGGIDFYNTISETSLLKRIEQLEQRIKELENKN